MDSRTGRDSLQKGALPFPGIETLFLGCPSLSRVARRGILFILISNSMIFLTIMFNNLAISNRSLENTG